MVSSATEGRRVFESSACNWLGLVIDIGLPEGPLAGLHLLRELRARCPVVPAVVVTGTIDRELANEVAALDATYVCKPPPLTGLAPFLARVVGRASAADKAMVLCRTAATRFGLTHRERQVLECVVRGEPVELFCSRVSISARTFRAHSASVLKKTGAASLRECALSLWRSVGVG